MCQRHLSYVFASLLLLAGMVSAAGQEPAPPVPAQQAAQAADGGPQEYVFRIGLYRLKQVPPEGTAGIHFHPEHPPRTEGHAPRIPHAFGSLSCDQCHAVSSLTTSKAAYTRTLADRVVGEALTASVAEVLAEPTLSTIEGRPAELRLQGGEVEYFVRDGEQRFRLERAEDESGVEVRLHVAAANCENDTLNVTVPFELRITTLDAREPIEGVALPIGKPVFRTFAWDATLTCHPGQLNAFTLDSPRQGRLLVMVWLELPEAGTKSDAAKTLAETETWQ